jgi:hypothetical protein
MEIFIHQHVFVMNSNYSKKDQKHLNLFKYFFRFFDNQNIGVYLIGSKNNLDFYKYGEIKPWDDHWDVEINMDPKVFQKKFHEKLSKKFQISTNGNQLKFKPIWMSSHSRIIENYVLFNAILKNKGNSPNQISYLNLNGMLIPQVYDPFGDYFSQQKEYFSLNPVQRTKEDCEKVKNSIKNHPGCVVHKSGSFFDELPCPCNRLTFGLKSNEN